MQKLTLAYTPCPNDTFMFHALASGRRGVPGRAIDVHMHDVEQLNRLALKATYDVTKISFFAWLRAREHYEMLDCGAALGFGCGPIVVARAGEATPDLRRCRIVVPGELTTGHLLLRLWEPAAANRVFVRYDEVIPMVADGRADCGVVIHEGRFVYERAGLRLLQDLGAWWEEKTRLPVPLGCIVARRSLGRETIRAVGAALRAGIQDSMADPASTLDYMRQHAQEMDADVLQKHVRTFVNEFSLDLGPQGRAAVAKLEELAGQPGVLP